MVVKAGIGFLGLSAISIGGVAFAKPEWLGINKEIPWDSLGKDHDYASKSGDGQDYNNKFGSKHKYYLVGVVGTDNNTSNPNTNKAMWEELFRKWKSDSANPTNKAALGKGFKDDIEAGVKIGNNGTGKNYLNTVCQEAYKADTSSITSTGGDDKYKESSIWKYCSPLGEKPKTIAEVDTGNQQYRDQVSGSDPIGKNDTDRQKLVSTKGNDLFWTIRDREFKNEDGHEKIDGDAKDDFFSTTKGKTIRQLCEQAYKSKASGSESTAKEPKKDKVMKYCTLDKSSQ